jgi:hypothetical protein
MNKKLIGLVILVAALVTGSANALDASGKRYAIMLASGGLGSMQRAAEEIYNQGLNDQELLDVAAESLAQNYDRGANGETFVDSISWLCKALGNSNNGRYRELLTKVSDSHIHKKARKYCDRAADSLPKKVAPYVVGSVNLDNYKEGGSAVSEPKVAGKGPSSNAPAANSGSTKASRSGRDFSQIREGMSQEEVEDLIGPPTSTTGHVTGKAFAPFNYRGKDTVRMYALYKGIGRIVYSNDSRYSGVYRVREIVVDAQESGYP